MTDLARVLDQIDRDLDNSLARLFEWLRFASISTDPAYADESRRCAEWTARFVSDLGFSARVGETGGSPAVVGRQSGAGGPHVLFYGHYDVQPVDPLELWETPPFEPRIATLPGTDRRVIVGRGACDDKGQVMIFLEACRAFKAVTGKLPVGITLLIEGEEENGSKNLPPFLAANKAELAADLALVCDTGMWDRTTPAITVSLRGLVYEEVMVRCADRDLHSGLFGGAAQNPIRVLSKALAALHDDNGRVQVPGFYDGVSELPPDVRAEYEALNLTAQDFLGPIGLKQPAGEKDRLIIEQISTRPTCDVNGIWGGYIGEGAKTVIPSEAHAKVSFRLVGDQDPIKVRDNFHAFMRARVPADCTIEFQSLKGSRAVQVPFASPTLNKAREALAVEWGKPAVRIGSGGSIPIIDDFKRTLGLDTLLVGFGLDDDRVHSPNEKFDMSSFHKGIRSWARILAALSA